MRFVSNTSLVCFQRHRQHPEERRDGHESEDDARKIERELHGPDEPALGVGLGRGRVSHR